MNTRPKLGRELPAAIWLAATFAAPWLHGPWATGRVVALIVTPGVATLLLAGMRFARQPARFTAAALLAAAVLAPSTFFAAYRLTGEPGPALVGYAALWTAVALIACLRSARGAPVPAPAGAESRGQEARPRRPLVTLAWLLGAALLITLPLLLNSDLRLRSDAWTHIALVRTILRDPYPWTDPRFAGEPLRYFWFLNVWAAAFSARAGTSIPWGLTLLNVAQATAWVAALSTYVRTLFPSRRLRQAAFAVVVAGLNPLGLLATPSHLAQALLGATRGPEQLARSLERIDFAGADVIFALTPYGTSFVAWIDKFLVITAFGTAMAAAAMLAGLILGAARDRRLSNEQLLLIACAFAAVLLHHLLAAALLALFIGGALGLPLLARRSALGVRPVLRILAVCAATALLAAPYHMSILLGRDATGSGFGLALQGRWWWTALVVLGPWLALGLYGRRRLRALLAHAYPHAVAWLIAGLAVALLIAMPSVNENKPIILLYCALAPLGAPGALALYDRWRPRRLTRWLAALLAVAALAVPLLIWTGFARERNPRVAPAVTAACRWLRTQTAPDALVIEPLRRRFVLNRAARDMWVGDRTFVRECGYDRERLFARADAVDRLYATGALADEMRARLAAANRPVYLLYLLAPYAGADDQAAPHPRRDQFELVFENPGARIYRLRDAPGED